MNDRSQSAYIYDPVYGRDLILGHLEYEIVVLTNTYSVNFDNDKVKVMTK
jgi:hypothetical protein